MSFWSDNDPTKRSTWDSALDTVNNIADQTIRYGGQMGTDIYKAHVNTARNAGNLSDLFSNPSDYVNSLLAPTFGDGETPGVWDQYGAWLNLVPGAQPIYWGVQGLDATYDRSRGGSDRQLGADLGQIGLSYAMAGQDVGGLGYGKNLQDAVSPYVGATGAAGVRGATQGALSTSINPGATGQDIGRGALIGGASGAAGQYAGSEYGDAAGKFAGTATSMGLSRYFQNRDREDPYAGLNEFIEQEKQRRAGLSVTPTIDSPALQEALVGTPMASIFGDDQENRDKRRPFTAGGNQMASSNSQVARDMVSDSPDYSGGYFI